MFFSLFIWGVWGPSRVLGLRSELSWHSYASRHCGNTFFDVTVTGQWSSPSACLLRKSFHRLDCSQSPIFPWDRRCESIVESDGPPSWSLDASETGESTKCPWVGVVPPHPHASNPITPTHRHFVLSPVSLASRDQDGARRTQRSTSTISRKNRGLWTVYRSVDEIAKGSVFRGV